MSYDSFDSGKNFYDSVHYPHGFSRAGIFTLKESDMLTRYGRVIHQLVLGEMQPENADHDEIIKVAHREKEAETELEKTWLKYQNAVEAKSVRYSPFSSHWTPTDASASSSEEDEESSEAW